MTSKQLDSFINDKCGVSYDGKSKNEIDLIRVFALCALCCCAANVVLKLVEGGSDDK